MNILNIYFRNYGGGYFKRLIRLLKASCNNGWNTHYVSRGRFPIKNNNAFFHKTPRLWNSSILVAAYYIFYLPVKTVFIARKNKIDLFVQFGFFYSYIVFLAGIILRIPVVTFVRSNWIDEVILAERSKASIILSKIIQRIGIWASSSIIVNSKSLEDEIKIITGKRSSEKIRLLYNNIDPIEDKQLEKYKTGKKALLNNMGITGSPFIIGYMGTFIPRKEVSLLINAFSKLKKEDSVLILAGSGGIETQLKERVKQLDLEKKVFFTGWLDDPLPVLACFDLMVYPTKFEGCPNSVLESLSCRVPTIGSKVTGIIDVLTDEKLVFPPSDEHALLAKLSPILNNPAEYTEIYNASMRCREKFCFNWDEAALELCLKTINQVHI